MKIQNLPLFQIFQVSSSGNHYDLRSNKDARYVGGVDFRNGVESIAHEIAGLEDAVLIQLVESIRKNRAELLGLPIPTAGVYEMKVEPNLPNRYRIARIRRDLDDAEWFGVLAERTAQCPDDFGVVLSARESELLSLIAEETKTLIGKLQSLFAAFDRVKANGHVY